MAVGDEVDVKVISVDQERKRIGLSLRQLKDDPWEDYIGGYKVGQLVKGKVSRLVKFGAFARLDEHIEGLIHISELSEDRIEHPKEVVNVDDELTLRIIKIEPERRRIGLSLRKVDSAAFSDIDWEMTLAELDEDDEAEKKDPGAELKEALGLSDESSDDEAPDEKSEMESKTEKETASEDAPAEAKAELDTEENKDEAAGDKDEAAGDKDEAADDKDEAADDKEEAADDKDEDADDKEEAADDKDEDADDKEDAADDKEASEKVED